MITARAFLMIREGPDDWTVRVHKDLSEIEAEWATRLTLDSASVAVLHVGFWRPSTDQVEPLVTKQAGRMLVTESARHALPPGHTTFGRRIGLVDDMSLFVATSGWGYKDEAPVKVESVASNATVAITYEHLFFREYGAKPDWVSHLLYNDKNLLERTNACGVDDEASYLQREGLLPDLLREELGWQRYLYYVGLLPDEESILSSLRFAPSWLLAKTIISLDLSVRASNALKAAGVTKVYDVAVLGEGGLKNIDNLGAKTMRELRAEILAVFVNGPWIRSSAEVAQVVASRKADVYRPERPPTRARIHARGEAAGRGPGLSKRVENRDYSDIKELLEICLEWPDDKHRDVLRLRMGFDGPPATLEEIGANRGVTRERIRQIESKAISRVRANRVWCEEVERRLSEILTESKFPIPLVGLEVFDKWFEGASEVRVPFAFALRYFCAGVFSIVDIDGQQIVTRLSAAEWAAALEKAKDIVAGFAGQGILESDVRESTEGLLPSNASELRDALWNEATKHAHFASFSYGRELVSVGIGVEHAVKAVLRQAATPLHYSEIQERCEERLSRKLEERRVHNAAANVGLLYGRGIFGLQTHLPFSEAECQSLVEAAEDILASASEGRQWHASEIVEALEEQDLNLSSPLDPYLLSVALSRSTEAVCLRRMIWTTQGGGATGSAHRIDVRQAVIALLQAEGKPLSASQIRKRLSAERGLNKTFQIPQGDSLIRVSMGIWGLIERDVPISPNERAQLEDILYEALRARGKALHVSEIKDVINGSMINLPPQLDPVLIADLAQRNGVMSLARGGLLFLCEWGGPRRPTLMQAVRDLFSSCADAGLTLDQVQEDLEKVVERPVSRISLPSYCDDVAVFSPDSNRWRPRQDELTSS